MLYMHSMIDPNFVCLQQEYLTTKQEFNLTWSGFCYLELVNPIEGHKEIENCNLGSTPIEGCFTPIWQNWSKAG